MSKGYRRHTVRFDPQTYEKVWIAANQQQIPVTAWIRIAIRHQLNQERSNSELSQLRDELGANFGRILDHCRSLSNAQQASIALVDTLTKYILSVSPEPSADAQRIGRRRYEQFLKSVAAALQGDVLRALMDLDETDKKPN